MSFWPDWQPGPPVQLGAEQHVCWLSLLFVANVMGIWLVYEIGSIVEIILVVYQNYVEWFLLVMNIITNAFTFLVIERDVKEREKVMVFRSRSSLAKTYSQQSLAHLFDLLIKSNTSHPLLTFKVSNNYHRKNISTFYDETSHFWK